MKKQYRVFETHDGEIDIVSQEDITQIIQTDPSIEYFDGSEWESIFDDQDFVDDSGDYYMSVGWQGQYDTYPLEEGKYRLHDQEFTRDEILELMREWESIEAIDWCDGANHTLKFVDYYYAREIEGNEKKAILAAYRRANFEGDGAVSFSDTTYLGRHLSTSRYADNFALASIGE